jgi:hypothetical protein
MCLCCADIGGRTTASGVLVLAKIPRKFQLRSVLNSNYITEYFMTGYYNQAENVMGNKAK